MAKPRKVTLNGKIVWQVFVREGGRGSKELKRRFPTFKEAQKFLDAFMTQKKSLQWNPYAPQCGAFNETTFAEEAENWLEGMKYRSSASHQRRAKDVLRVFNRWYGDIRPNQITPEFLAALQRRLKRRPGRER